jgi:hypothetical protein
VVARWFFAHSWVLSVSAPVSASRVAVKSSTGTAALWWASAYAATRPTPTVSATPTMGRARPSPDRTVASPLVAVVAVSAFRRESIADR